MEHWWWKWQPLVMALSKLHITFGKDWRFVSNGCVQSPKDKCVFIKGDTTNVAYCGVTVDDCFFVTTRNPEWKQQQIYMVKNQYEVITVEEGDELGLIGIQIKMDRVKKLVHMTQMKNIERIFSTFKPTKGVPTPAIANLMGDDPDSPPTKRPRWICRRHIVLPNTSTDPRLQLSDFSTKGHEDGC